MEKPRDEGDGQRRNGASEPLHFGDFELDPETAELRKLGEIVPLRPLAARALMLLVRRAGRLTSREDLRQALWADSFLDWNQALNQCIRQIRRTLGDSAETPIFLETVHHRGYRFVAEVTSGLEVEGAVAAETLHRRGGYGPFLAGMGAMLAVIALLISICSLR